ncbi:MAG: FAD-dependent monooxygenase [Myxococcota bacterium]
MNVLVVGGGIGGVSVAIALSRAGHTVRLVERGAQFSPAGAGIVLAPNAARTLEWLEVDLGSHGQEVRSMDVVRADGALLSKIEPTRFAQGYGPSWALTRPALHAALLAALPKAVEVRLGLSLASLEQSADHLTVRFEGDGAPERYDLVVGADGLRSTVRSSACGEPSYRYSGVTCYRGVTKNPGFDRVIEAWGNEARIGIVPLREGQLYYYLVHSAPRRAPPLAFPQGFREVFGHLRGGVERLFEVLDAAPPLHHDLEELEAPVWGSGRVLLLGDAAHGMTPNQGQGAAMAIEDALALTEALESGADGALSRYEALRHARVRKVQLDSRRIGQVAHFANPVLRWARDHLTPLLPRAAADAQYQGLVDPGLALLERAQARAG